MSNRWHLRENEIKLLRRVAVGFLVLIVLADLLVHHHGRFGPDGTFGFGAWFGFASIVALVAIAKAIGAILQRADDYHER